MGRTVTQKGAVLASESPCGPQVKYEYVQQHWKQKWHIKMSQRDMTEVSVEVRSQEGVLCRALCGVGRHTNSGRTTPVLPCTVWTGLPDLGPCVQKQELSSECRFWLTGFRKGGGAGFCYALKATFQTQDPKFNSKCLVNLLFLQFIGEE